MQHVVHVSLPASLTGVVPKGSMKDLYVVLTSVMIGNYISSGDGER
jgi:hypothetical protein